MQQVMYFEMINIYLSIYIAIMLENKNNYINNKLKIIS